MIRTYVKARQASKQINLHQQGIDVFLEVHFDCCFAFGYGVVSIRSNVMLNELSSLSFGGHASMVTIIPSPLSEVISYVECGL